MSKGDEVLLSSRWIESNRPERNQVDPYRPYAWLVEKERAASGKNVDTGIVFISNKS